MHLVTFINKLQETAPKWLTVKIEQEFSAIHIICGDSLLYLLVDSVTLEIYKLDYVKPSEEDKVSELIQKSAQYILSNWVVIDKD